MPSFTRKLSDLIAEDFNFGLTHEDYPIFDESYREQLNQKILKHYWNYEIGQETESMFRFSLNRKMNEIMPYYNQLYLSTRIQFDPLQTMNYTNFSHATSTDNFDKDSTGNNTSDTASKARSVSSVTPQVQLSQNEDYAANASDANSDAVTNASTTGNEHATNTGANTNENTVQGSQGMPSADLLMRYRATFLNIDMNVITELESLFMQIWDNGDEFTHSEGMYYGWGTGFNRVI